MIKRLYDRSQLAIFVISLALVAGCNTFNTDYERDNPNDPGGTNFIHSNPDQFSVEIENGVIDIRWKDVSEYNSGYIADHYLLTVEHEQSGTVESFELLPGESSKTIEIEMKTGWSRYLKPIYIGTVV